MEQDNSTEENKDKIISPNSPLGLFDTSFLEIPKHV